jgi:hypothetical protein
MAREFRCKEGPPGDKLNFLGGKRTRRGQSAVGVAAAKADIESGGVLARETIARLGLPVLVQWCPHSKYALFFAEVTGSADMQVDVLSSGLAAVGVKRLEWVPLTDLCSSAFVRAELHEFAAKMVADLQSPGCDILGNLPKVLASMEPPPPPVAPGRTDAQKHDFDAVAAIKASAATARPEDREFHGGRQQGKWPQQSSDVARCIGAIPKNDLRKLQLRFHPDKLQVQLCREPSGEERSLAGIAMRLLNEAVQASSSVFNSVKELDEIIRRYVSGLAPQPAQTPVDKMAELLGQMRMHPA